MIIQIPVLEVEKEGDIPPFLESNRVLIDV